jgi:superoxide dismutase, Fe-Mn family
MKRRQLLIGLGTFAALGYAADVSIESAQAQMTSQPAQKSPQNLDPKPIFSLPALPYAYNALEPYIDEKTMTFHHDKHHAAYVAALNIAFAKYPQLKAPQSLESMLRNINDYPAAIRETIRNNGGGHVNHSMFWQIMSPQGGGEPIGAIAAEIDSTFGSFDRFQSLFNQAGASRFGAGWAWLVRNKSGKLEVVSTANQDSPLMLGDYPILGNDVWEHAYYLNYQNRRIDYLKAWWNVVNWEEVNKRYQTSLSKPNRKI